MNRSFLLTALVALLLPGSAEPGVFAADPAPRPAGAPEPNTTEADAPWSARWIGPESAGPNTWTCFRKTFTLERVPTAVPARIAVDSKYWLWINGRMAVFEGGLKRGPAPGDGYYDTLDLAPHLRPGANTIAVLAWYWGKEGFSHKSSGKAGFVLEVPPTSGVPSTGPAWKMRIHPAYGTAGDPQPNYRLSESSILFDAQKDMPGWTAAGYDDSAWGAPAEAGSPPAAPWGRLVRRPIPFWKDYGLKEYANAAELPAVGDGKVVTGRLPYNAHVTPYLKIDAPAGLKIDLRTDNLLGGGEPNLHAEYITREGVQEYESLGWMNGHEVRYSLPAGVKILSLRFRETGYDAAFAGAFACDDPFFNTLWEKSRRTLYVTMRDNYMDCPDRERAQWWGDAVNEIGESFYVFDPPAGALARKAILELAAWQRPDKSLFSPVPAGNWNQELPPQMLASVGKYGFWTYYLYSGDDRTLRTVYPRVRDYLNIWKLDADGLAVHRKGEWDWADWGENIDVPLLDSAWYHLALQGGVEMARLCGEEGDIPQWQSRMAALEKGFNARFWKGTEYRSPGYQGDTDDRGNALAVVAGLAGADKHPALRAVLAKHRNASPYMEKYVLEALYLLDDAQGALDRMKLRYAGMVARPVSTLAEHMDGAGTYNHAWSGGPLTLLSQYAAGVAPLQPAYAKYQVLPRMGALKSIDAVVPTVQGNIRLALKQDGNGFSLDLTSPDGTQAVVGIPRAGNRRIARVEANGTVVRAAGKPGEAVPGLGFTEEDDRYCRFAVAPGLWKFRAVYE